MFEQECANCQLMTRLPSWLSAHALPPCHCYRLCICCHYRLLANNYLYLAAALISIYQACNQFTPEPTSLVVSAETCTAAPD